MTDRSKKNVKTVQLLRSLNDLPPDLRRGAVSIGNFDGVHWGHARIVAQLRAMAERVGGPAVVFTFDPHPVRLLRPELAPPPLTWTDRKAELLAGLGVDAVVAYPTDRQLLSLLPQEFFDQIVRGQLEAQGMVEGPNFYFGRDRAGTVDVLRELCTQANVELEVVQPLRIGTSDEFISSSRVRRLIAAGDVDLARQMLTQPYRIRGMVTHGAARGAQIGFPTANIEAIDTILPGMGVYAGRTFVRGDCWPTALNLGPNPTFGEDEVKVEAHLIGYEGSLYGQAVEVDFLARLRDIQPFANVEALKEQLARDVRRADEIAAEES